MSRLSDRYRAARGDADPRTADSEALETALAAIYARARARYPDFAIDDLMFVSHLAKCDAPVWLGAEGLHAEDLFLACAAAAGDLRAVDELRAAYRPVAVGYTRRLIGSESSLDDLVQRLWTELLVGDDGRPAKLDSYSGTGALAGYVGITAQRMALRDLRNEDAATRTAERAAAEANLVAGDAELELMKQRYRREFEGAVRAALDVLDDRQRMILRLRVLDGLTVDRIAKAYGVGQATMSRWLEQAREQVRSEARRELRARVPLSESDFDALAGLLTSQLDLSLSNVLQVRA